MWPAIISAAGNIAGSLLGSSVQGSNSKRLMRYQYQLNQQSLRESPSAQLEGLTNAGLNPVLYMANGSAQYPTVSSASAQGPDLSRVGSDSVGAWRDSKRADQQERLADASVQQSEANANFASAKAQQATIEAQTTQAKMESEVLKNLAQADLSKDQTKSGDFYRANLSAQSKLAADKVLSQSALRDLQSVQQAYIKDNMLTNSAKRAEIGQRVLSLRNLDALRDAQRLLAMDRILTGSHQRDLIDSQRDLARYNQQSWLSRELGTGIDLLSRVMDFGDKPAQSKINQGASDLWYFVKRFWRYLNRPRPKSESFRDFRGGFPGR